MLSQRDARISGLVGDASTPEDNLNHQAIYTDLARDQTAYPRLSVRAASSKPPTGRLVR